jgi:hypothetical protein
MSYTMRDFQRELLFRQLVENYREENIVVSYTMQNFQKEFVLGHLDEILKGISPDQILQRYSPDERLKSLSVEEIEAWLKKHKKDPAV